MLVGRKTGGTSAAASVTGGGSTNILAGAASQKSATIRRGTIAPTADDIPARFYEATNSREDKE